MKNYFFLLVFFLLLASGQAWASCLAASGGFQNLIFTVCWISGALITISGLRALFKTTAKNPQRKTGAIMFVTGMIFCFIPWGYLVSVKSFSAHLPRPCCPVEHRHDSKTTFRDMSGGCGPVCRCFDAPIPVSLNVMEKIVETKALEGDVEAQLKIGNYYYHNSQRDEDDTIAFSWWSKAAEAGNTEAQDRIALSYHVKDDLVMRWLPVSARRGNIEAMVKLASQYERGFFSREPDNFVEAYFWYNLAAAQPQCKPDNVQGQKKISQWCRTHERTPSVIMQISNQQIESVIQRVREWKPSPQMPAR